MSVAAVHTLHIEEIEGMVDEKENKKQGKGERGEVRRT